MGGQAVTPGIAQPNSPFIAAELELPHRGIKIGATDSAEILVIPDGKTFHMTGFTITNDGGTTGRAFIQAYQGLGTGSAACGVVTLLPNTTAICSGSEIFTVQNNGIGGDNLTIQHTFGTTKCCVSVWGFLTDTVV